MNVRQAKKIFRSPDNYNSDQIRRANKIVTNPFRMFRKCAGKVSDSLKNIVKSLNEYKNDD